MSRRYRLIFLGFALLLLFLVGWAVTGSFDFVLHDFWFSSGLLLLILLSVVDQPFFSKDANIFMNGVAGAISLVSVDAASRNVFWYVFLSWSLYLVVASFILMVLRTRKLKEEPKIVSLGSRINRQIGRPEAIFSAFFLWGVFAQFASDSAPYKALLLYWAVFLILNVPSVAEALAALLTRRNPSVISATGTVVTFISPRFLECEFPHSVPPLQPGTEAIIRLPSGPVVASGQVVDDRFLKGVRIAIVAITARTDSWSRVAEPGDEDSGLAVEIIPTSSRPQTDIPTGTVSSGSDIGRLHLRANPDSDLVAGEVLAVDLAKTRGYYQVVSATLKMDRLGDNEQIQDVEVVASQLGIWRMDRCRFEPVSWVAPAGGLVYRLRASAPLYESIPTGQLEIGKVPNSLFPVHLNLDDVVTHNTAILGVTGSGKSYLAFSLIEGILSAGIRVLVLDISRQHWIFLRKHAPFQIKDSSDLPKWMGSDNRIAIHQFASSTNYPETTSQIVEKAFGILEKSIKLRAGKNEPARLCLVLEEAHSLIPEWNQVSQKGDDQHVNKTARVVLQGRKYGMGCIIISQRTANVTKTILNQCNTIVALQSFDQTGLDFLSNYMGNEYANAISTLPLYHAVLVGKASSSTRPILFKIQDMSSRWDDQPEAESESGGETEHGHTGEE